MPLLYGKGARAFKRLREVILARSEDYTVFLWTQICNGHDSPSSSALSSFALQFSRRDFPHEYMYRDSYKVWLTAVTYSKCSDVRIFNLEIPDEDDSHGTGPEDDGQGWGQQAAVERNCPLGTPLVTSRGVKRTFLISSNGSARVAWLNCTTVGAELGLVLIPIRVSEPHQQAPNRAWIDRSRRFKWSLQNILA